MATRQKTGSIHWGEKSRDEGGFVFQTLSFPAQGPTVSAGRAMPWAGVTRLL